jgi:signal transduction histidine kinase
MSTRVNLMRLIALAAAVAGATAVTVARRHPDLSLAGDAAWASVARLVAGWALVAAGLAHWSRHPASRCGALLAGGGLAWFLIEAANPEVGSALLFSAGLVLFAACPPLIAHAALAHAHGRLRTRGETAVVALGYAAGVGVLGLLSATLYDPAAQGCLECPANLVHLGGGADAARTVSRAGLWLVFGWGALVVAFLAWRLARANAASRRLSAPVLATAAAYVALVAADAAHGIGRGFESNDPTDRALWGGQALALIALSAAVTWERIRSARMRAELTRLLAELDRPLAGGVRDALARALGEPQLALAYASSSGGWLDAEGRAVTLSPTATQLGPTNAPVAAIVHRPGALQDPELVAEITRAARPALEQERLQAEMRAQLAELQASRTRIVAAADAERRRLERDLHDGAQQRIVALALDLRLARRHITRRVPELDAELGAAEDDLRLAVAELRDVARGIHPPMLADGGLAAALHALAEEEPRLTVGEIPGERLPASTDAAAYYVVTETLRSVANERVSIHAQLAGTTLELSIVAEAGVPAAMVDAQDRVGAIGGRLLREDSGVLRVELPCG